MVPDIRPFGMYVHVPFCATRCGYCDFNTYTASELGGGAGGGVNAATFPELAIAEVRQARRVLGSADLPVSTVFVGGGTPTLIDPDGLGRIVAVIDAEFGLDAEAEVTTEANPESVDELGLARLREVGFTRLSLGMQSVRPQVLAALDRTHTPGRPQRCVRWARAAGFEQISLDLIYGAPGETTGDWQASLDAVVEAQADHVSAYALIVEDGTRLARQVRRGEVIPVDDDELADRYLMAEDTLTRAGLGWYEVSNWAKPGAHCRHNIGYWRGEDWWGIGPGAHSHRDGTRWWNVKHPAAYAARLAAGASPEQGRELLDAAQRHAERIMLRVRTSEGLALSELTSAGRVTANRMTGEGLLEPGAYSTGRAVPTLRGRLFADAIARDLVP
jgi:putative oxygen-independent coproporphyrinogen III oxidase